MSRSEAAFGKSEIGSSLGDDTWQTVFATNAVSVATKLVPFDKYIEQMMNDPIIKENMYAQFEESIRKRQKDRHEEKTRQIAWLERYDEA